MKIWYVTIPCTMGDESELARTANERAVADAILRSAAPDLLSALEQLVIRAGSAESLRELRNGLSMERAKAAIAKATGE